MLFNDNFYQLYNKNYKVKETSYYISSRDIRKLIPDNIVMMNTCLHLSKQGHEVIFLSLLYYNKYGEASCRDVWSLFNLPNRSFKIVFLPVFFQRGKFCIFFKLIVHFLYGTKIFLNVLLLKENSINIISRDIISTYPYLILLSIFRKSKKVRFVYEVHDPSLKYHSKNLYKHMDAIYCTTDKVKNLLIENLKIDKKKITTIRNGFDPSNYEKNRKKEYRYKLKLPIDKHIVMYTGKIARHMKEIYMILDAAKNISDSLFIFVGGRERNLKYLKNYCRTEKINNALFVGLVPYKIIPKYQISADILLMYYPGDWTIRDSLSPTKMVEYMATGNPIISVDFDTIREVLKHKKNAYLIEPDSTKRLIYAIKYLKSHPKLSEMIGRKARDDAKGFSWENRAMKIKELIGHKNY